MSSPPFISFMVKFLYLSTANRCQLTTARLSDKVACMDPVLSSTAICCPLTTEHSSDQVAY